MLYSPINYQGNKSRIVDNLIEMIPKNIDSICEVFCGSAIFSLASDVKTIYLNDINIHILNLIKYFKNERADKIIYTTDAIINKYGLTNTFYEGKEKYPEQKHEGLSRYNKVAYTMLRSDYNKDYDISKLFVLTIYGFNHYLRFNKSNSFNVPVGKTDFVKSLREKTIEYCQAINNKDIMFSNKDFTDESIYRNSKNTLYYFDPPYLITQAPYNAFWSNKEEEKLLNLIDKLNSNGIKFMLSNVIASNGKENTLLKNWMKKYNVRYIKRQYLNSSYQKKNLSNAVEVIIYNYNFEGK